MAITADQWVDSAALVSCSGADDAARVAAANLATAVLNKATAYQYGERSFTVRPMACNPVCGCAIGLGCPCSDSTRLRLPGYVSSVTTVKVDGAALAPAAWALYDHVFVQRLDGYGFTCCQSLTRDASQAGTIEVAYLRGMPVPADATEAARSLACELLKAQAGASGCRLPTGTTSVVREGVAFTIVDPRDLLKDGRTGLYDVDLWLAGVNPSGLQSPPVVRSPDEALARRLT